MFAHGDSAVQADDIVLVISNAPDLLLAKRIAHVLVEEGLVACVNLGAIGLSMYMWAGRLEGGEEVPITMKTTRARVHELVVRLQQLHPDEIPEILVLPVLGGLTSYVDWVRERTA
ncbi:MAG: divalent-cation tolerance protein CutA [Paralcaligenes sp.]